ncbi:MAG: hypothetical protein BWY61_00352 [Firmicutes bacterium ADurb.Bin354]|nr:MAG: hypothetical protein BWY61_00352 [Firmicutes bacterium ADurb.Bin354]SCX78495.1 hypothetical protein SAMN02910370_00120 [Lachnospiraceae bacterium XPB1003]
MPLTILYILVIIAACGAGYYFLFTKRHPMYHEGSLSSGEISVYMFELSKHGVKYGEYRFSIFGDKITYEFNPSSMIIPVIIVVIAIFSCVAIGFSVLSTIIVVLFFTFLATIMLSIKILICKHYIRKNVLFQ